MPILTPLKGEVASLIKNKKIGLHYKDGSSISLKKKIYELLNDKKKLNLFLINVKKIYKSDYNYNLVYENAVNLIEKVYKKKNLRKKFFFFFFFFHCQFEKNNLF